MVVRRLTLLAHALRELFRQHRLAVIVPGGKQGVRRIGDQFCHMHAAHVRAFGAFALHKHDLLRACDRHGRDKRFLHAAQARDRHHFFRVVEPVSRIADFLAGDHQHPFIRLRGGKAARLQFGVVRTVRLECASRTDRSASAAADAFLGRDDELVVLVGNTAGRADFRAFHAPRVAIAHHSAARLVNGNILALQLFQKPEDAVDARHGIPFSSRRAPPQRAQSGGCISQSWHPARVQRRTQAPRFRRHAICIPPSKARAGGAVVHPPPVFMQRTRSFRN